jgi:hypothetical protein
LLRRAVSRSKTAILTLKKIFIFFAPSLDRRGRLARIGLAAGQPRRIPFPPTNADRRLGATANDRERDSIDRNLPQGFEIAKHWAQNWVAKTVFGG